MTHLLLLGDCLEQLSVLPDASVDAIVTDPPYELGFMGKSWDSSGIAFSVPMWREALRALKPGGHLLAFSGARTYHRMACAIEDAGFEIRDQIMWVYGSGFPKSLDVSKAIDKASGALRKEPAGRHATAKSQVAIAGNNRECITCGRQRGGQPGNCQCPKHSEPATDNALQWEGWGTALKPAHEPICVARKPLIGTVVQNVLEHGTGALNIDACRIEAHDDQLAAKYASIQKAGSRSNSIYGTDIRDRAGAAPHSAGRWPANFIHDGSEEILAAFPDARSACYASPPESRRQHASQSLIHNWGYGPKASSGYTDAGSAARFFYCAKASKKDRDEGLDEFIAVKTNEERKIDADSAYQRGATLRANSHPTVKPTDLMTYLCRLVTPPGGVVLDPFMGSGSTGKACAREGFFFVGVERDPEYFKIAKARIEYVYQQAKKETI